MDMYTGPETLNILGDKSLIKKKLPVIKLFLLSVLAGCFIAEGYLAFVRISGTTPKEWGGFNSFLGGCVFPMGLIAIVLVGGELLTGNMMTMAIGVYQNKVGIKDLGFNWIMVILGNLVGGVIIAFLFGHMVGLTEGDFLAKTLAVAQSKVNDSPLVAIISGIGCNIFVCMAVWFSTQAKTFSGKILGMWFPVMVFVLIGFQHVVANTFIIPAAIFSGQSDITWLDFIENIIFVFIGNGIGGALAFGLPCCLMYGKDAEKLAKKDK